MSQYETLMARDGHPFNAYIAKPAGHARGGVVVIQEVFGLTAQIRHLADSFAAQGYLSIAPALFDRVRRDLVLGYSKADLEEGSGYRRQIPSEQSVMDISAAAAVARHTGKVAVVGYCWGGLLAWLTACETPLGAAVCYYGAHIADHLQRTPGCPTLLHFGTRDASIPADDVERIRSAFPQGAYHLYDAGHAFSNEDRADRYDAAAATEARAYTDAFLRRHIG